MKNEQLRNFIKVVDCGSINKAAEQLYVSQPSLSRSISTLEEEMGKELVIAVIGELHLRQQGDCYVITGAQF